MNPVTLLLTLYVLTTSLQGTRQQDSRQSRSHRVRHERQSARDSRPGGGYQDAAFDEWGPTMEEDEALQHYGSTLDQMLVRVNCSRSCTKRETMRQLRLDSIKQEILKKLKITTPPIVNISAIPDIPLVRTMYRNQMQRDSPTHAKLIYRGPSRAAGPYGVENIDRSVESLYTRHSINIINFAELADNSSTNTTIRFSLEKSALHRTMLLQQASLGVYIRPVTRHHSDVTFRRNHQNYLTLTLYMIDWHDQIQYYTKRRLSLATRIQQGEQWAEFEVTSLVRDWLRNPQLNRGVAIDLSSRDFEIISRPRNPEEMRHRPYLELTVRQRLDEEEDYTGRSRRSTRREDCDERGVDKLCCRYPLSVNFDDFGWDWIIAPRQYDAFYCAGDCPFAYINTNANTYMVHQSRSTVKASGGPCCSASNLSPISLLYFDSDMTIIRGTLPDMVVNKCKCA